jgi:hypothetical protein
MEKIGDGEMGKLLLLRAAQLRRDKVAAGGE